MKHPIDPKVDCVFKALFGTAENSNLLIHFLNAVLNTDLAMPITTVEILNPFNERESVTDKLSVVDIKAQDQQGRRYQIEIQIIHYPNLPARIAYNWCDIYSQQLQSGQDYLELKPTYSIWLLENTLIKDDTEYAHRIALRDERGRRQLLDNGGIYLFELSKFTTKQVHTETQRWLKFFKEGEKLNTANLPNWMQTQEMKQAMNTLYAFSEKERDYFAYQAHQEYLREQRTIQREIEESRQQLKTAQQAQAAAQQEKEAALAEIERLRTLLAKSTTSAI